MMDLFDISTVIFDEGLLNETFNGLNIERSEIFNIGETNSPTLNHNYKSKDQIVTFEFDNGTRRHKVITYDSAQRLYQSKRGGFLSGPEKEEEARLSSNAFKSGMVDSGNFVSGAGEWYTIDIDLAFKCNWMKFRQNKHFADELLATERKFIVCPGTATSEKDWPVITAKILMIIRDDLRRQAERQN